MFDLQTEKIQLPQNSTYQFGAVTYEVAAFFDAEKPQLQEKLKKLLADEIKSHPNCTFADG